MMSDDPMTCIHRERGLCPECLAEAEAAGLWPGYVESVVDFDVAGELELTFADDD